MKTNRRLQPHKSSSIQKKKGEILLECARLVPTLKGDIRNLEKEVYRLQRIEKEFNNIKEMFKNLVS